MLKLFQKNVYWWFKSVDTGQETLWVPGEEKEDCRGGVVNWSLEEVQFFLKMLMEELYKCSNSQVGHVLG